MAPLFTFEMVAFLIIDALLSEKLLDENEAILDEIVIAHFAWALCFFCHSKLTFFKLIKS